MKPEDMNIRHFKLINGDNILALVHKKEQGRVIVERPVIVTETIIGSYSLRPWFSFSSQTLYTILDSDIMAHVLIDEDVKHTYLKAVTTPMSPADIRSVDELSDELERYMSETLEDILPSDTIPKKTYH
jgi:hypothetical protein